MPKIDGILIEMGDRVLISGPIRFADVAAKYPRDVTGEPLFAKYPYALVVARNLRFNCAAKPLPFSANVPDYSPAHTGEHYTVEFADLTLESPEEDEDSIMLANRLAARHPQDCLIAYVFLGDAAPHT
jgi:hypothetical protein